MSAGILGGGSVTLGIKFSALGWLVLPVFALTSESI
jgi:hypothetical protein